MSTSATQGGHKNHEKKAATVCVMFPVTLSRSYMSVAKGDPGGSVVIQFRDRFFVSKLMEQYSVQ